MSEKTFPIMPYRRSEAETKPAHPTRIPWSIADLAYSEYSARYGTGQSLERLAERGGFGASEMDDYLPDWRDRCSRIAELESQIKTWADAALVSLAGLTATPEQGYLKDGGVQQFRADAERMRREMTRKESA